MSINHFFNKSIVIRRLVSVTGYKKAYQSTGTIDVHIQKISREDDLTIYGVYGATHKAWCDVSSDVKKDDKVTDDDGIIYVYYSCSCSCCDFEKDVKFEESKHKIVDKEEGKK